MWENRGYCFWCGVECDPEDWDEISPGHKVNCCDSAVCRRELRRAAQDAYADAQFEAQHEVEREWGIRA